MADTLGGMVEYFLSPEMLEGSNQYHCDHCQVLRNAEKQLCLLDPPPSQLVLTLKRFAYDPQLRRQTKILTEIRYPESLCLPYATLSKSPVEDDPMDVSNSESTDPPPSSSNDISASRLSSTSSFAQYTLYGVIMHSGQSAEHGHYYSYARSSRAASDGTPSQWFMFNDSSVSLSSVDSFTTITRRFPTDVAYILFYARSDVAGNRISPPVHSAVPIPPHLINEVIADNKKFLLELENQRRAQEQQRTISYRNNGSHYDDEDGNSWQGDGSGGFGGLGGSRYVC